MSEYFQDLGVIFDYKIAFINHINIYHWFSVRFNSIKTFGAAYTLDLDWFMF